MAGRYSPTATSNFGVFLRGHAGDDLRIDRVGRSPEFVIKPAVTVGLAVQPEVIRGLASRPGFRGRGLLGRFLYSLPASFLGHRNVDPPPMPPEIKETYRSHIFALLDLHFDQDEHAALCPHELKMEVNAQVRLQKFAEWVEPQLAEFGDLGSITDWAGKLVGAVARITGILHMAALASIPAPWDHPIPEATVEQRHPDREVPHPAR